MNAITTRPRFIGCMLLPIVLLYSSKITALFISPASTCDCVASYKEVLSKDCFLVMSPSLEVSINSLSCKPGFYLSFDLVCLPCDNNCAQCQGDATFCTACNQNFVLTANNTCLCPAGYSASGSSCVSKAG